MHEFFRLLEISACLVDARLRDFKAYTELYVVLYENAQGCFQHKKHKQVYSQWRVLHTPYTDYKARRTIARLLTCKLPTLHNSCRMHLLCP